MVSEYSTNAFALYIMILRNKQQSDLSHHRSPKKFYEKRVIQLLTSVMSQLVQVNYLNCVNLL